MNLTKEFKIPQSTLTAWQDLLDLMTLKLIVPVALIMKIELPTIEVFLSSHSEGNPYKPGDSEKLECSGLYCEYVYNNKHSLKVPNALKDPIWEHNPDIKLGMISYYGFPLLWPNGDVFGTLCILDTKENPFEEGHKEALETFQSYINLYLELHACRQLEVDQSKCLELDAKCSQAFSKIEALLHHT